MQFFFVYRRSYLLWTPVIKKTRKYVFYERRWSKAKGTFQRAFYAQSQATFTGGLDRRPIYNVGSDV